MHALTFNNGITVPPVNTNTYTPTSGTSPPPGQPLVFMATGDSAAGRTEGDDVVALIQAQNPNLFVYLGDVYEKGTSTEFFNWYGNNGSSWSSLRSITNPAIGNHEFENGVAPGYFDYWDNVPDFYSYDAGGWHFIVLNSDNNIGTFTPGTPQHNWLVADLAASSASCTLAYFHHPIVSIGGQGNTPRMIPLWEVLVDNGVRIVLGAHDHNYQRFQPLDRNLQVDPNGTTSFVAGGGGHGITPFVNSDARLAYGNDTRPAAFGALRFELNPAGATFAYVNTSGSTIDSGTIPCTLAPDTVAPSTPTNLAASSVTSIQVDLGWTASTENVGVDEYRVIRNGSQIDTVQGAVTEYSDVNVDPFTTYTYAIIAADAAGNPSPASVPIVVTTPAPPPVFTKTPVADSYVDGNQLGQNFGLSQTLRVDTTPDRRTYVRFNVNGINAPVTSATLRIYTNSTHPLGFEVHELSDNGWQETTITHSNAPAFGPSLAFSGPTTAGQYREVDVTGYVTADGFYNFVLTGLNSTSLPMGSRESANQPKLVITQNTSQPGVADSYVDANTPATNFGLAPTILVGTSPEQRGYLRFDVSGLTTPVTDATLRLYVDNAHPQGFEVQHVTNDVWGEQTINFNNAPGFGPVVGASGATTAGQYHDIDLTEHITGNGTYSLALTALGAPAISLGSRESANPPQLNVIEQGPNSAPIAHNQSVPTTTNTPVVITLTAIDLDGDCPLGFSIVGTGTGTLSPITNTQCSNGVASADVTYTPSPGTAGADAFTFEVTDPTPATSNLATVNVSITAGLPPIQPSDDATVRPGINSTTNYGSDPDLLVDASSVKDFLLRFNVAGVGATTVLNATLRLHATNSSPIGGIFTATTNNGWSESTVTFDSAPVPNGIAPGNWYELDVTPLITGDGPVSIRVSSTSPNGADYASKENIAALAPELVITLS